jgi:hypothetical protein
MRSNRHLCNVIRKKAYLFNLWLATLLVLSVTFLPHHHHLKAVCFTEEICDVDGNINDQHTAHHATEPESNSEDCSIDQIKQIFIGEKGLQQLKQAVSQQAHRLYAVVLSILAIPQADVSPYEKAFQEPLIRFLDCCISSGGLRAPPIL